MSAYVTNTLRFTDEATEVDCEGHMGEPCKAGNGEPAFAIHTVRVRYYGNQIQNLCAIHSPFSNIYVPCESCHTKPAIPNEADERMCEDCIRELMTACADAVFSQPTMPLLEVIENEDSDLCEDCHETLEESVEDGSTICPNGCEGV